MTLPELLRAARPGLGERLLDQRVDRGVVEPRGRVGLEHRPLGALLVGELGAAGAVERLDRLRPLLDLLRGDARGPRRRRARGRTSFSRLRDRRPRASEARRPPPCRPTSSTPSSARGVCSFSDAPTRRLPPRAPALIVVVACGVLCVAYGIAIERRWYRLRTYDLAILPPAGPETARRAAPVGSALHAGRRARKRGSSHGCRPPT